MPEVLLGEVAPDSVAATVYVLVRHGVEARPQRARELRCDVVLRFAEDYPAVRIRFGGEEVHVLDDDGSPADLTLSGRMGDVNALLTCPLRGGMPSPTSPEGRAVLSRLADGRIGLDGTIRLARRLLMLLEVSPARARPPS